MNKLNKLRQGQEINLDFLNNFIESINALIDEFALAEENNEKLAAVQNQQAASGVHVDQNAIQKELAQNSASSGHRRTISSGVKAAQAPAKKWWEFWKK